MSDIASVDPSHHAKLEMEWVALQKQIIEQRIPVMIIFEGDQEEMKGQLINKLIKPLDHRWINVYAVKHYQEMYMDYPYLKPFWLMTPTNGKISILDKGWYTDKLTSTRDQQELNDYSIRIAQFENQLKSEGTIIIKLFIQSTNSPLLKKLDKGWIHLNETSVKQNEEKMLTTIIDNVKDALSKDIKPTITLTPYQPDFSFDHIDLAKSLDKETYKIRLVDYNRRMKEISNTLRTKKKSLLILLEGWDGSGKSGSIQSITAPLDPRQYKVVPHATIKDLELNHHYLYYYWSLVPKWGDILIMDRTWYKWVMENRIYNKCTAEKSERSYQHIQEMEQELYDSGVILLKFWLHIDKDEQLRRFHFRVQNDPSVKQNQLDDDWRNREKWDEFKSCAEEMIDRTSKPHVPWVVVESNSRFFARDKLFRTILDAVELQN